MTTALGLLAVLALILANGWFVAAEFSFVAARRTRLEELAAAGDARARRALEMAGRLSFMLSGAQLGITATSLLVGFIARPVFSRALAPVLGPFGLPAAAVDAVALTTGLILATGAQMVLGELAPKNLAIARPEAIACALARPTWMYTQLAGPVIRLFDGAANALLRLIGFSPAQELRAGVSTDELGFIIEQSGKQGSLTASQATLLSRALGFRELRAADVMVPRPRVVSIPAAATCADVGRLAVASGHSRFPAVGDGLDEVEGIIHAKDILAVAAAQRAGTPARALLKPLPEVPESVPLRTLLARLRAEHSQMAIVVDEYGDAAGIVTLEDVVEELVGSIQDEYDRAEPAVHPLASGAYVVPGSWRVDEVARDTGLPLPPGDYDTVGGLMMERLGRVPQTGDVVEVDGLRLRVLQMQGLAVARALLVAVDPPGPGSEPRPQGPDRP